MTVGVGKVQDDIFSSVKTGFETAEMALNCQFYLGQGLNLLLDYISQLMLRLLYSIQNIVSDEDFSGILQKSGVISCL